MKIKRYKINKKYKVSVLPDEIEESSIELGIPVKVVSIYDLNLEKVDEVLNDLYSGYLVNYQDTPSQDTLNSMLRVAFLRTLIDGEK